MTLTHGADTEALKKSSGVLRGKGREVEALAGRADKAARRLEVVWRGQDSDAFASAWTRCSKGLAGVSEGLVQMAKALDVEAQQQEKTSEELVGGAGVGAGLGAGAGAGGGGADGGTATPDGEQAYIAPVIDGWDDESKEHPLFPSVSAEEMNKDKSLVDGTLDPAVEERWNQMSREEREETIRALVSERAEANGVRMPNIDISDLQHTLSEEEIKEGKTPGMGYWSEESRTMRIRDDLLDDPRQVIAIIGHEMRHAGQKEMDRDADMGWLERKLVGEPFTGGLSDEQLEAIRQNNLEGEYRTQERDGYDAYHYQPVEVDARNAGKAYVDGMTVEQLEHRRSLFDYLAGPLILPRRGS